MQTRNRGDTSPRPVPRLRAEQRIIRRHEEAACAAWSLHAAELAEPIAAEIQQWAETPSTRVLVAEGQLVRLLPGRYLPGDLVDSAIRRALALGCAMGGALRSHHVIGGPSAAWVLLGGAPPHVPELITPAHRGDVAGVQMRRAALHHGDVETLGGAPLTTPLRTAMDLLRFAPPSTAAPLLGALLRSGHLEASQVQRRLAAVRRSPGIRAARQRWDAVLGLSGP